MSHCALRQAWEGDSPASWNVLVSPETGLVTLFANIAAGDWCIAVGSSVLGQKACVLHRLRRGYPFIPYAQFAGILSVSADGGIREASWLKRTEFL